MRSGPGGAGELGASSELLIFSGSKGLFNSDNFFTTLKAW